MDPRICVHPACSCRLDPLGDLSEYCSTHCESADDSHQSCGCGHDDCRVEQSSD